MNELTDRPRTCQVGAQSDMLQNEIKLADSARISQNAKPLQLELCDDHQREIRDIEEYFKQRDGT